MPKYEQLLCPSPAGLYCRPGDFYIVEANTPETIVERMITMIRQRIDAGLKTVKAAIADKGVFTARSFGIVRKRLGRPNADPKKVETARRELAKGTGVLKTAKLVGLGTGTVQRLKQSSGASTSSRSGTPA